MKTYPPIYFIRHGETAWNAEGRLQGQQDIALNTTGHNQAAYVGTLLKNLTNLPQNIDFISSPMLRTQDTMQRLRLSAGLDPASYKTDERLKEISFGRWEGLTWPEVRKADPKGASGREADKWNYVPPNGESYEMLMERIVPWLESIIDPSLVVAHGGVARVLLVLAAGQDKLIAPQIDIRQGKILLFEQGKFSWVG
jgi:broad specificity phosphatase PhoE